MNKNNFKTVKLQKGEVRVYDFGVAKLHAYETNALITDEVFILEKNGRALIIEAPCFVDNIEELNEYVSGLSVEVVAMLLSYHMAGGAFLPDVPVYATQNAVEFAHFGGGKTIVDKFIGAFGTAFDPSLHTVTHIIEARSLEIAGFVLNIVSTPDAFDIEIPELGVAYIHMLGHDYHSIVGGAGYADDMIAQLEGFIERRLDLILTSHHTPEDLEDAQVKIEYLKDLKTSAAASPSADAFKESMRQKYPTYKGENYLDMTASFLFGERES